MANTSRKLLGLKPKGDANYTNHDMTVLVGLHVLQRSGFVPPKKYQVLTKENSQETFFVAPAVTAENIAYYLNGEVVKENDQKKNLLADEDVFNEFDQTFLEQQTARTTILFPCLHEEVWHSVEISINKNGRSYQIDIRGIAQEDIKQRLQAAIQRRMESLDPNGILTFSYATTAAAELREGGLSKADSALHVIETITSRLYKSSQAIHDPLALRQAHIELVDSLPDESLFKGDFLYRHTQLPDLTVEIDEPYVLESYSDDKEQTEFLFEEIVVLPGKTLRLKNVHLVGKSINVQGKLELENSTVTALEDFNLGEAGNIEFDTLKLEAKEIILDGRCLKIGDAVSQDAKDIIKASKKIVINIGAQLIADNLFVSAPEVDASGDIRANQSTLISADWLMQRGRISSPTAHYKIDQAMINRGFTTSVTTKIDTTALFNFCHIRGSDNFTVNAGIDFNFGITQSFNYTSNALVKFSAMHMPDMPENWKDIFSTTAVKQLTKTAATVAFPAIAPVVNWLSSLWGTYDAVSRVWQQGKTLYAESKTRELKFSDFLPLLVSVKDAGFSIKQSVTQTVSLSKQAINSSQKTKDLADTTKKAYQEEGIACATKTALTGAWDVAKTTTATIADTIADSSRGALTDIPGAVKAVVKTAKKVASEVEWKKVRNETAKAAFNTVLPKYSADSFVNASGVIVSGSVNQRNFWSANAVTAAVSSNMHSEKSQHIGYLAAYDASFTGGDFTSHGDVHAANSLQMEVARLTVREDSTLYGFKPQIAAHNARLFGRVKLKDNASNVDKPQISISGETYVAAGAAVELDQVVVKTAKLTTEQSSAVQAVQQSAVFAENAAIGGNLKVKQSLMDVAHDLMLLESSAVQLQSSKLHSENLHEDGKLSAATQSSVTVDEKTTTSKTADVKLDQSEFKTSELDHAGKLALDNGGRAIAETTHNKGDINLANQSVFDSKRLDTAQDSSVRVTQQSEVRAESARFNGDLALSDSSALQVKHDLTLGVTNNTTLQDSSSKSEILQVDGKLAASKSHVHTDKKAIFSETSETKASDTAFKAGSVDLEGQLEGKGELKFDVDGGFTTTETSKISAEKGAIIAGDISHSGDAEFSNGLYVNSNTLTNWGTFKTRGGAQYNVNGYMLNVGYLNGDNISIHAGAYVNLWSTRADSVAVNSLVSLNFGLTSTNSYLNNSLISCNFGLNVPTIPTSFSQVLRPSALVSVGKAALTTVCPIVGKAVDLFHTAYNLSSSATSFSDRFSQLMAQDSPIQLSELISLVADAKNVCGSFSAYASFDPSAASPSISDAMTSALFPTYSNNSLISLNTGKIISGNVYDTSMYFNNAGTLYAANNLVSSSMYFENSGTVEGSKVTVNSDHVNNSGDITGSERLNLQIERLDNQGQITASTELVANIGEYAGAEGSKLVSENKSQVKLGNAQVAGEVTLKNKQTSQSGEQTQASTSETTKPSDTSTSTNEQPKPQIVADTVTVSGKGQFNIAGSIAQIDHLATTDQSQASFIASKVTGKSVTVSDASKFAATDTQYTGDTYASGGKTELTDSLMVFQQSFKDTGYAGTDNAKILTAEYSKDGILDFSHQLSIQADRKVVTTETSRLQKQGDGSVLHIKSKEEELRGHIDTSTLVLDVEQLKEASELVSQSDKFQQVHVSDQLICKTDQHVVLDKATQRECGVALTAKSIDVQQVTQSKKDIFLQTTKGNLTVQADVVAGQSTTLVSEGKVINKAATIKSNDDNVIVAKQGYEGITHSRTYVAERYTRSSFWGLKTETVERTQTDFQDAVVVSMNGRNCIYVTDGGIQSTAASFIAKDGTLLSATGDIDLCGVKYTDREHVNKTYVWGLFGSDRTTEQQRLKPTLIYDAGTSRLETKANINAHGIAILGAGDLELQCQNAHFAAERLRHSSEQITWGLDINGFGVATVKAAAQGQNPLPALASEEALFNKSRVLFNSGNTAEVLANSWNLGIESYNTMNSLARGYQYDSLSGELLQRYGLGGEQGFSPTLTATAGATQTKQDYETLDGSMIHRRSIRADVSGTLKLDGMPVIADQDAILHAKKIVQTGQLLNSSSQIDSGSISVGFTPSGITHVGMSYSQAEADATTSAHQTLQVGGKLDIHADEWVMDGASTHAQQVIGAVDRMTAISRQNIEQSNLTSVAANTLGFFSANVLETDSATTVQPSGLFAVDTQQLSVNDAKTITPTDYAHRSGIGISAVITDLLPGNSDHPNKKAVSTAAVQYVSDSVAINLDVPVKADTQAPQNISGALQQLFEKPIELQSVTDSVSENLAVVTTLSEDVVNKKIDTVELGSDGVEILSEVAESSASDDLLHTEQLQRTDNTVVDMQPETSALSSKSDQAAVEVVDTGFAPQTHDVTVGWKNGRNRKQKYDLRDGQYVDWEKIEEKIQTENATREISHQLAIALKRDWSAGAHIFWQAGSQFGYKDHVIKPMLVGDKGHICFVAEFDPLQKHIDIQIESGIGLRFNLAQGSQRLGDLGKCEYAVDAGSIAGALDLSITNERKIGIQGSLELGALGPNAGGKISSAELCLFGFTLQYEGAANLGVGAKISGGAGITFDKTQFKLRPHFKVGGYFGVGGEGKLSANLGIDMSLPQRMYQAVEASIETIQTDPVHKKINDKCEGIIKSSGSSLDQSIAREVLDAEAEYMAMVAIGKAVLSLLPVRKEATVSQPKIKQAENLSGVGMFAQKQTEQTKVEVNQEKIVKSIETAVPISALIK